jgi:hypothetical protein
MAPDKFESARILLCHSMCFRCGTALTIWISHAVRMTRDELARALIQGFFGSFFRSFSEVSKAS